MTRLLWIGAAIVMVALSSGCGADAAGNPVPAGNDARATTTDNPAPARPRPLRLDGKDPCALVPEADWAEFSIEKPGKLKQDETLKSPKCFYSNNTGIFDVTLVMNEGIDAWRSGQRAAQPGEVAPVRGFPAISLLQPSNKTACDIVVDVAEGQYLMATVIIDPNEVSKVPDRCAYAHRLAESAMSTLVAS